MIAVGLRPRITKEVRDLIQRMSLENPFWGATKIHGELLKLGKKSRAVAGDSRSHVGRSAMKTTPPTATRM
jgi:hypothetical protein